MKIRKNVLTGVSGFPASFVHFQFNVGIVVGDGFSDEDEALDGGLHRSADAPQRPA